MVSALKHNGTFLLNCVYGDPATIAKKVPKGLLKRLAEKDVKFYVVDANKIAQSVGMAKRTNTIM